MTKAESLFVLFLALTLLFAVFSVWLSHRKERRIRRVIQSARVIPMAEFEENWILPTEPGAQPKGYKYQKQPGCYAIFIFDKPVKDGNYSRFDDIYIGQSVNVTNRVHSHFTGKGNGDVYADMKYGRYLYLQIIPCDREDLNDLEKALIEEFHATESYNETRGGGTEWSERKHGLFHLHRS